MKNVSICDSKINELAIWVFGGSAGVRWQWRREALPRSDQPGAIAPSRTGVLGCQLTPELAAAFATMHCGIGSDDDTELSRIETGHGNDE